MNKKYMDFVPKNTTKKKQPRKVVPEARLERPAEENIPRKSAQTNKVEKPALDRVPKDRVVRKKEAPKALAKPAFVNTEKVRKRPLSKNVYQKKVVTPREETPSAPVTIIDKPEKDSKVGLIVTIIITIILGAAAGTVAFLLLPKL